MRERTRYDEEQIRFDVPAILQEDLGITGLKPDNTNVKIPVKKPKKKELPAHEKFFNIQVSGKRVKVEHTIG